MHEVQTGSVTAGTVSLQAPLSSHLPWPAQEVFGSSQQHLVLGRQCCGPGVGADPFLALRLEGNAQTPVRTLAEEQSAGWTGLPPNRFLLVFNKQNTTHLVKIISSWIWGSVREKPDPSIMRSPRSRAQADAV